MFQMSFLALPFAMRDAKAELSKHFNVRKHTRKLNAHDILSAASQR
jgi:hypothetical protein